MYILGIETSCDETAAAVVEDGCVILSNVISSQIELHRKWGGIVPEIASRAHMENILPVLHEALSDSGKRLSDMSAVAVTMGPGLIGALLVGVSAAKALAYSARLPLVGVNHIEGHMGAAFLDAPDIRMPLVMLTVSGGHSHLYYVRGFRDYEKLGQTRDDAAGEAYDKVAKLLGLPYPGGPVIDEIAGTALTHRQEPVPTLPLRGEGDKVDTIIGARGEKKGNEMIPRQGGAGGPKFPRAYLEAGSLDFSFSGLKTAVLNYVRGGGRPPSGEAGLSDETVSQICREFQTAVVDVLVKKSVQAVKNKNAETLVVTGGVASNSALRSALTEAARENNFRLVIPRPALCTDNAAMIASAGYHLFRMGVRAGLDLNPQANLPLEKMK
ncbi:MAG: tRNA (adenosine(37)-N6)-threonylcarbamoyltransferase complex transferase subunit TsaD [Nitrospirota bacterium]